MDKRQFSIKRAMLYTITRYINQMIQYLWKYSLDSTIVLEPDTVVQVYCQKEEAFCYSVLQVDGRKFKTGGGEESEQNLNHLVQ